MVDATRACSSIARGDELSQSRQHKAGNDQADEGPPQHLRQLPVHSCKENQAQDHCDQHQDPGDRGRLRTAVVDADSDGRHDHPATLTEPRSHVPWPRIALIFAYGAPGINHGHAVEIVHAPHHRGHPAVTGRKPSKLRVVAVCLLLAAGWVGVAGPAGWWSHSQGIDWALEDNGRGPNYQLVASLLYWTPVFCVAVVLAARDSSDG